MTSPARVLEAGSRCVLAVLDDTGDLHVVPTLHWYDGTALWIAAPDDLAADAETLRCVVCVAGPDAEVVAEGRGRVLSLHDPASLLLHAPAITGALAGFALHDPASVADLVRDALRDPATALPTARAALHLVVDEVRTLPDGQPPVGIAPALPAAIPADVRRAVAGMRRIVLVHTDARGAIGVQVASLGSGFALTTAGGAAVQAEGPVAVVLDPGTPSLREARGLVLHGHVREGVLHSRRATWWRGLRTETVDLPEARAGVLLPD